MLTGANLFVTVMRFVLLRAWVFVRRPCVEPFAIPESMHSSVCGPGVNGVEDSKGCAQRLKVAHKDSEGVS